MKGKVYNIEYMPFLYPIDNAKPRVTICPNNTNTQRLYPLLKMFADSFNISSAITENIDDLENYIYQTDSNAFGISWDNSDQADAYTNPQFSVFTQKTYGSPEEGILQLLLRYVSMFSSVEVPRQPYPSVESSNEYDIHILVAFFAIVPIILATMPNVQNILDDKDSRITTYMFLMGMSETQHWIVNFVMMLMLLMCQMLHSHHKYIFIYHE